MWWLVRSCQNPLQELSRPRFLGVFEDFGWRPLFDDGAFVHVDDAVGDLVGEAHLVGGEEHGHAEGFEAGDDLQDFADHFGVEG